MQHSGNIKLLSKLPALYSNDSKRNRRSNSGGVRSAKNFTSFRRRNSASIDADILRSADLEKHGETHDTLNVVVEPI